MVAAHRSASANALRESALEVWPGMTIFWLGDPAHASTVSGHNPDDTPGVRAEESDADTDPEVRSLDFMIGPKFGAGDAHNLVKALISGPDARRIRYVIYNRTIYRSATGFDPEPYKGKDPHTNHVHTSGKASDDENGAPYRSVEGLAEMTVGQLHGLLREVLGADTPTERQTRDMIRGGQHAPGGSILGPTNDRITAVETTLEAVRGTLEALVQSVAFLATQIGTGGVGTHTHVTTGPVVDAPDAPEN